MNKIVVTGGAGRLGRLVIEDLTAEGYSVLAVDRVRPEKLRCRFLQTDLTDAAAIHDVLRDADAVIHLGAVPGPGLEPQPVTFRNNVLSTYYVVEAAAALGLKKVVTGSSLFGVGWHEDPEVYWPKYVPLDEEHPLTPFEAYGLSKQIGEEICAAVSRRTGMPTVGLRFTNIIQLDSYQGFPWPAPTSERGVRFVMWPYLDVRDAALACRQALEAGTEGHEAFFIAAGETRFNMPTAALLREFAPHVEIRGPLEGLASVISTEKARQLIGFQPQYSWQMEVNAR